MMKRLMSAIMAMLVLSLPGMGICESDQEIPTIVTIVPAPDQTQPERPPCFPDPA